MLQRLGAMVVFAVHLLMTAPALADGGMAFMSDSGPDMSSIGVSLPHLPAPPFAGDGLLQRIDQCGSTDLYCDDIGFPQCLYDVSEDSYYCCTRDGIGCAVNRGPDYCCPGNHYCCTGGCCRN